jgi:hypothetical protein
MEKEPISNQTETMLKSELIKYVVASALGIIVFLLLQIGKEVAIVYNLATLPEISSRLLFLISMLLGVLFLLTSFLAFRFYRKTHVKPPSGGYLFVVDPGYYYHIKTGGHFCNPCLAKGFASRLSLHHEDGLKCRLCGEVYISPTASSAAFLDYMDKYAKTDEQLEHHFSKYKEP